MDPKHPPIPFGGGMVRVGELWLGCPVGCGRGQLDGLLSYILLVKWPVSKFLGYADGIHLKGILFGVALCRVGSCLSSRSRGQDLRVIVVGDGLFLFFE